MHEHVDQVVSNVMRFFPHDPFVSLLPCIITDGNCVFVGRFERASSPSPEAKDGI